MDAKRFVANWKAEKACFIKSMDEPGSLAGERLSALHLSELQTLQFPKFLDAILTDVMYTLLLGLDGCASIGGDQKLYSIRDENGTLISGIEAAAYEEFHGGA